MKRMAQWFLVLSLLTLMATLAMAAEGGNPKKGKHLFKKSCKGCHVEGAEGKLITPMTKTQAQWDRFFGKGEHADCLKGLSETEVKDIQQFLYDHAADSDQPATCG
jgi:cytochrome c5